MQSVAAHAKRLAAAGDLFRDFKSFTSKGKLKIIEENPQVSKKEWMLNSFKKQD